MSPPTTPFKFPASEEIARIIIGALKSRNYDAGLTDRSGVLQHNDFDITIFWNNLHIGSKRRNRSYLQVTWDRRILTFVTYGRRWQAGPTPEDFKQIDLADPDSFNKIVDFIVSVADQDKFKYPFI